MFHCRITHALIQASFEHLFYQRNRKTLKCLFIMPTFFVGKYSWYTQDQDALCRFKLKRLISLNFQSPEVSVESLKLFPLTVSYKL